MCFEQLQGAPCLLPLELAVGHLEGAALCCKHLLLHVNRRGLGGGVFLQRELLGRELLPGCLHRWYVSLGNNYRSVNQ